MLELDGYACVAEDNYTWILLSHNHPAVIPKIGDLLALEIMHSILDAAQIDNARFFTLLGQAGLWSRLADRFNHLLNRPDVIGKASFHRRRDTQGFVNTSEVVVHEVKCDLIGVVLDLLREGISAETREEGYCAASG